MFANLFIAVFLLLSWCALARGSLKVSNYTGAGVSNELQNQILTAIINAYNKYKTGNIPEQAQSISDELEENTNYKFTVILTNEVPQDSWFTLKTNDEVYAVWTGVNKMQITWTYYILANGLKDEEKTKKMTFFWKGSGDVVGKGISGSQRYVIRDTILSLEGTSCYSAGRQLGMALSQMDSQSWTSICKAITLGGNGILLVASNQQYYIGKGNKCICMTFA